MAIMKTFPTIRSFALFLFLALLLPGIACAAVPTLSSTTTYWTQVNFKSSVTDTTAKLGATIDSDGGDAILERGIVWNTTGAPTLSDNVITEGSTAVGSYFITASGLPTATLVYFSGYATNAQGTGYSPESSFYTEPTAAAAPTVDAPTGTNYFDLTVNYTKPGNADGVLVVARSSSSLSTPPYDGLEYTPDARFGSGDSTEPGCMIFCEYVVANDTASGSVNITGLKDNTKYYFAVYAYKGLGAGITGINYVQTISPSSPVTTDTVPAAGKSHNELYVAQGGAGGTMTSADCANCHGVHHTSQLLPTGLDMYNKCFVCHQAGGAADPKIDIAMHLADGSVDCGTCHTMHSFTEEELYSTDHGGTSGFNQSFVRSNMAKYLNTANGFAVDALEPTVFQTRPDDFAYASGDPPYNAVCQSCHDPADGRTTHHNQAGTDDHHISGGVAEDCTTCHSHKNTDEYNAFFPSGGHAADFGKDATCTVCHDPTDTKNVVSDIHNGDCTICHSGSPSSSNEKLGDAANGIDGDARLANGTAAAGTWASVTCLTCHPSATYPAPDVHHDSKNNYAVNGNCTQCHTDPRVARGYPIINQMSCRACHVRLNGTTVEILAITIGKEGGAGTGLATGNTFTPITTANGFSTNHTIANSNAAGVNDAIQNYGSCFDCHGATGRPNYSSAPKPVPYHALPQPGAYDAVLNTIGGDGWQGNLTATPDVTHFRGNQNWDAQSNNSYWPVGKGRLNVGYAQHGLAKGSTNTVYKVTNTTAGGVYQNFVAGLRFGKQIVQHLGGTPAAYVPHFDSTYTGNDTVTITSGPTTVTSKGQTLGWTISATSSTSANLHIIWGGVDMGTISSGGTFTATYKDTSTDPVDQHYCLDQFNSYNPSPVAIVSEDGGYATATGVPLRGTSTGETPSSPQTCTYK